MPDAEFTFELENVSDDLIDLVFGERRPHMHREITAALKPQPLPHAARVATLAVVFILEQHAEVMATDVGAGVAAYQRAVQRAGDLRRLAEIPWEHRDAADELDQDARALYNELTT